MPIICPAGSYCPTGSPLPTPCEVGTYSNTEGLEAQSNCTDCDPGSYCNDTGKVDYVKLIYVFNPVETSNTLFQEG